jgi:hypothetical protein
MEQIVEVAKFILDYNNMHGFGRHRAEVAFSDVMANNFDMDKDDLFYDDLSIALVAAHDRVNDKNFTVLHAESFRKQYLVVVYHNKKAKEIILDLFNTWDKQYKGWRQMVLSHADKYEIQSFDLKDSFALRLGYAPQDHILFGKYHGLKRRDDMRHCAKRIAKELEEMLDKLALMRLWQGQTIRAVQQWHPHGPDSEDMKPEDRVVLRDIFRSYGQKYNQRNETGRAELDQYCGEMAAGRVPIAEVHEFAKGLGVEYNDYDTWQDVCTKIKDKLAGRPTPLLSMRDVGHRIVDKKERDEREHNEHQKRERERIEDQDYEDYMNQRADLRRRMQELDNEVPYYEDPDRLQRQHREQLRMDQELAQRLERGED